MRVTQSELAESLGVRRESVGMTLAKYAQQGLIKTLRGKVEILDRPGLERWSCSCHALWRQRRWTEPTLLPG